MKLSVVIPTYARADALGLTLESWSSQDPPPDELIVVDDGSPDAATRAAVEKHAATAPFPVDYVRQANAGPAAARNLGASRASGDVLVFSGDDMVPEAGLVGAHMAGHGDRDAGLAILGLTVWAPFVPVTPLMAWIDHGCFLPQFEYAALRPGEPVPWSCFYTSNVSLSRRDFVAAGGFDPRFRYAYGEDGELGYRLHRGGVSIVYAPEAIVYHNHPTSMTMLSRRAWVAGATASLLPEHDPALDAPAPRWRRRHRLNLDMVARAVTPLLQQWDSARLPINRPVAGVINWSLRRRFLAGIEQAHDAR